MSNSIHSTIVTMNNGRKISIEDVTESTNSPFTRIAPLITYKKGMHPMNILNITKNLSKSEHDFLLKLTNNTNDFTDYTYPLFILPESKNIKSNLYRAYSNLKKKNLVKKVLQDETVVVETIFKNKKTILTKHIIKGEYIINPDFIRPYLEDVAIILWKSIP